MTNNYNKHNYFKGTRMSKSYLETQPDENGYFGKYGGAFLPPPLVEPK